MVEKIVSRRQSSQQQQWAVGPNQPPHAMALGHEKAGNPDGFMYGSTITSSAMLQVLMVLPMVLYCVVMTDFGMRPQRKRQEKDELT